MKKATMKNRTSGAKAYKAVSVLATLLMAILPVSGVGSFATAARAGAFNPDKDTSLQTFTIDDVAVNDQDVIEKPYGTAEVSVVAIPTNPDADVVVSGDSNLDSGTNLLQVDVTSADSSVTKTYKVTVNVLYNDDTSLAVFSVNGEDVVDNDIITLDYGTTEADVIAQPADENATVEINGNSGLVPGNNPVIVTVTAANGTTFEHRITLKVAENNDTSLSVLGVDEADEKDVLPDAVINLKSGTKEVNVRVETTDSAATYVIVGATDLKPGSNKVTITVTAADGVTKQDYTLTFVIPEFSNNTALKTFTIDGRDVSDSSGVTTLTIGLGRSTVEVEAVTDDPYATAVITGNTDLSDVKANIIKVTVTADDGTVLEYVRTVIVAVPSPDASIDSVKVNGVTFEGALDGTGVFNAVYGTTSVSVAVKTSNAGAIVKVTDNTGFVNDTTNTVKIKVTAEDGTVLNYSFKVVVAAANTNRNLASLKVNGVDVLETGSLDLLYGTTEVTVEAVTEAPTSTFVIDGANTLVPGKNKLTVTVASQSDEIKEYTIKLNVLPASNDTDIDSVKVNGVPVVSGAVELPRGTTTYELVPVLSNAFATYTVSGDGSIAGVTTKVTITVTAQDGTKNDTEVTITVPVADTVNTLDALSVDGDSIALSDAVVEKPFETTSVEVTYTKTSAKSSVIVTGDKALNTGLNTVLVAVTSESGVTNTYSFKVNVAKSSNTGVSSIKVNDTEVSETKTFTAEIGATSVDVSVVTADPGATFKVTKNTDLKSGDNEVVVTVTAADEKTEKDYVITVTVPELSNDTSLKSLSVGGKTIDLADIANTIELESGTTSVDVSAEATDAGAIVTITGNSALKTGENTVVVNVKAPSGASLDYNLKISVALSDDATLKSILVNAQEIKEGDTVTVSPGTEEVTVSATANDPDAVVTVAGDKDLGPNSNTVTVTVTAPSGKAVEYKFYVNVLVASNNADLTVFKINGVDVLSNASSGDPIEVDGLVDQAVVVFQTKSANATAEVTTSTDLLVGDNTITVRVTSEDGTATKDYSVVVKRLSPLSSETGIESIKIGETGVEVNGTYEASFGTSSVEVTVVTTSEAATYEVVGNTGLKTGENEVTITVTAENGDKASYLFNVKVAKSNNIKLTSVKVNGETVALDALEYSVSASTEDVTVVVETEDVDATVTFSGDKGLKNGENKVDIEVTAADGTTKETYVLTVTRAEYSNNTNASITVNGEKVDPDATVEVDPGTKEVSVVATAEDVDATVEITGQTDLDAGNNYVYIKVTAANKDVYTYTITIFVKSLSNNTELETFTVDGTDVMDLDELTISGLANFVTVIATPKDPNAEISSITGANGLEFGDNELEVVVTAEDGVTTHSYKINLIYPDINNVDLKTFTVNGNDVKGETKIDLDPYTASVEVVVDTYWGSTYDISGNEGLNPGENTLTVIVTSANGEKSQEYTLTLNVLLSSDTSLEVFEVAGHDVLEFNSIDLEAYTTEVEVNVETNDENSTYEVTGATGLEPGQNSLVVTVTAPNGDVHEYELFLIVALGNKTTLATFTVNGNDVEDGATVELDPYTTSVEVEAVAEDENATVDISGGSDLVVGENVLTVTVTAQNGDDVAEYNLVLLVAKGNKTTLSTFTVNGEDVEDGGTVELDPYTTSVEVEAVAEDENATVEIAGSSDLAPGENTLTVTVTAENGDDVQEYNVTLIVALGNDTSLKVFTVNGEEAADGFNLDLEPYTTEVSVEALATDPDATVEVAGDSGLEAGENTLTVTVTAANGDIAEYKVSLNVLLSADTSLAVFTVNETDVQDGDTVELDPYTTEVVIVAEATDENSTVEITGGADLTYGENTLTVAVTAPNGDVQEYNVTLKVALGNDNSLATFTVNGNDVQDGDTVDLEPYTESVEVEAVATDDNATLEIVGNDGLQPGENVLTVTVTAQNGEDIAEYNVILMVALSADTSLATFTVNGSDVQDGDTVDLEPYTESVEVEAVATDENSTVEITGASDLVAGENTLTVTVTAPNGDSQDYFVTLNVALSPDNSLATFTVNGDDVENGSVVDLEPYTTSVDVEAIATDENATVEIIGGSDLVDGENTLTVTVTAVNGDVAKYFVTLNVALSADTSLATFTVNGSDVQDGDTVDLEWGTTEVDYEVVANDINATVEVVGGSALVTGDNTLTVSVTAPNGDVAEYNVTLRVAQNSDNSLAVFSINGEDVQDGDLVSLDPYTTEVEVIAEATDIENANVEISGGSDLVVGDNTLLVTVTAENGDVAEYTVTLNVPLGDKTALATFTVNGNDVQDGATVELEPYTTSVEVEAVAEDENAQVEVVGFEELVTGENTLTVTVTAQNGDVQEYNVTLNVALGNDTSLATFTVNGNDVADGDVVEELEYGTTEVEVVAIPTDADATAEISGDMDLISGDNILTITVTAANGVDISVSRVTLRVLYNNDTSLAFFTVNGNEVQDGDTVDLEYGTTEVDVVAEASDEDATFEVIGGSDLVTGENTLIVRVTAADGETFQDYTITLNVALNSDATLAVFAINGEDVSAGDVIELQYGTSSVDVAADASDDLAEVEISGATDLQPGENTLTVTVTAQNGDSVEYTVTLVVALNNDTSLRSLTVNGNSVNDKDYINLPANTTSVDVEAIATDGDAQVEVAGNEDLAPGANTVTITVTAADGKTIKEYTININVLLSSETGVSEILLNGTSVKDGDILQTLDQDFIGAEVDVEVTTLDENATVEINGNTDLQPKDNLITIVVTAPNGDKKTYKVTFRIGGLSANANLKTLVVAGKSLDINGVDLSVDILSTVTSVTVLAITEEDAASIKILGNKGLKFDLVKGGTSLVEVLVTAADGKTVKSYKVTLNAEGLSDNTNLSSLTVNGKSVANGSRVILAPGSGSVRVVGVPEDTHSIVSYSSMVLKSGLNTITVTVTAASGAQANYTVEVVSPALSSDTGLKSFTIEGLSVLTKTKLTVLKGTTKLHISAEANDSGASVEIIGRDILPGVNDVSVRVTAADGTVKVYTVKVKA